MDEPHQDAELAAERSRLTLGKDKIMKYQTQKVAMLYFYGALGLFVAQVLFGVLAGTVYVLPNTLSELLPFNIIRMIHTNALIVWLLIGFMGSTYYLLPEEAETELY